VAGHGKSEEFDTLKSFPTVLYSYTGNHLLKYREPLLVVLS
jgi:hypothetical protein